MGEMGRLMMIAGGSLFVIGLLLFLAGRVPGIGQLPGDITVQRGNFTFFAPLGTMIVLSIVLTVILNLVARFWR